MKRGKNVIDPAYFVLGSRIEKIPRDIQCEMSRKDTTSSEKFVETVGHKQVPKGTEPGVRKGKRSLLTYHICCKYSMY